jgi:hypothetical protein
VPPDKMKVDDLVIEGYGEVKLPEGMTQEEADRLAREADEERERSC